MNLDDTLQALRALSFITRFRILNLLYQKQQPLSQDQLVNLLEVSKSNISRHAKKLHNSTLIIEWKNGKHLYYALNPNLKPKSILNLLKEFQTAPQLQKDSRKLKALKTPKS